jgi:hypothetical protein
MLAKKLLDLYEAEKIFIPKGNLGIDRRDMPQIQEKDFPEFKKFLKENNVSFKIGTVKGKELHPIQKKINVEQVISLADKNSPKLKKLIIVTKKDNFIIDGHHRWLAVLRLDKEAELKAFLIDMKVKDFLELAKKFSKIQY